MNPPTRRGAVVRPILTLLAACFGLLLIPAIASLGAMRPPPRAGVAALPVAARQCDGQPCPELVEMEVKDVVPLEAESHAVVLVTKDRETVLPIFVDESAAVAIAFRLAHRAAPHPQAPDLMDSLMIGLGGELTEVRIDRVEDQVFTGQVLITQGQRHLQLDARPSDSIALALAHGVKIFASKQVLSRAGISQAEIDRLRKVQRRPDQGLGGSGFGTGSGDEGADSPQVPQGKGEPIRL